MTCHGIGICVVFKVLFLQIFYDVDISSTLIPLLQNFTFLAASLDVHDFQDLMQITRSFNFEKSVRLCQSLRHRN